MCGLVGIVSQSPVAVRDWLVVGRDAMQHRGPDDAGLWWSEDGRIGLAHRRLAVIDLSPGGHQPMLDADGGLVIVFNGEIYNFAELRAELRELGFCFVSESDTEVILAAYKAWGTACLDRLDGMFALAIVDRRRRSVLLARDRAGEKPLFYRLADGELRFASELKALLADATLPRQVDRASLDCFLYMGFVPGARCMLQGFNKLPAAHAMEFSLDSGKLRVWPYWTLPEYEPPSGLLDEVALLDELESLLTNSIRRQLVADVPVGVLLSGGVDSSLVTALAARINSKVKTFTIRFPGYGKFDETEHARLVAQHFGTEHIEMIAGASTAELLPSLARQFDEPMVDSSMVPTFLLSQMVRQHCTVALGGDGADELFGGYGHYSKLAKLHQQSRCVPLPLRKASALLAGRLLPLGYRGTNIHSWLHAAGSDLAHELPLIASYFDGGSRRQLMASCGNWALPAEKIHAAAVPRQRDLMQRAMRTDFKTYLPEDILVKIDRTSMMHSLELRAPMLDRQVVEFAARKVPSALKATVGGKKILLKYLVARLLPADFNLHRKQGFSIPLRDWLKAGGPFRTLFEQVLLDTASVFDVRFVQGLMRGQDLGRGNEERLFALVMFELWRREYGVSV